MFWHELQSQKKAHFDLTELANTAQFAYFVLLCYHTLNCQRFSVLLSLIFGKKGGQSLSFLIWATHYFTAGNLLLVPHHGNFSRLEYVWKTTRVK